jgi:predicted anti-sigma-YlaC factor YlaD
MKKILNITCKKATYLISKKEDGKLGFIDSIKLKLHLSICSACRLFENQSWFIKINANHSHEHLDVTLSEEAKQKLTTALKSIQ